MADITINELTKGTPTGNSILPYSTGSNTLGVPVSAILQNAGNIGIGTAAPEVKLHVVGDICTPGRMGIGTLSPARQLTVDSVTNPEIGLYTAGTERVKLSTGGSAVSQLVIDTAGQPRVIINSTGMGIGIGTTAPAERLTVMGNMSASGDVKASNTPKAWVNFDGTGAIGTNQTIRSSYNVASVYKGNTGSYRITFTSAQTDNNYCVTGASAPAYSAYWTNLALHTAAPTNGGTESAPTNAYFDVCVVMQTAGKVDSKYVSVVVL